METGEHGLTLVRPPVDLANEFMRADRIEQTDLYNASTKLYRQLVPVPEIRNRIVAAGWSPRFADWYAEQLDRHGCYLEIEPLRQTMPLSAEPRTSPSRPSYYWTVHWILFVGVLRNINKPIFGVVLFVWLGCLAGMYWVSQNKRLH